MKINKCQRCGAFFANDSLICPSCVTKDANDINKLNNFFVDDTQEYSINELSNATGIKEKNLERFIANRRFKTNRKANKLLV